MQLKYLTAYWHLGIATWLAMGGALATSGDCALAQITPDGTLGAESSVVTPININGRTTERIDGGATRGANLFHSFDSFSVPTGGAAYFNNAANIQNIFSRVTGTSVSNIDGLLRANSTANLFLLNPNGIIFGPNASLNIGGSFLASTASQLNFADGTNFTATAHPTTPLLTVSVPIGLQYGGNAGGIQVHQSILQVQKSQTLALVGGDVSVEGGEFGYLEALGGRIELGGVTGAGTVGLNADGNNLSLSYPAGVQRTDVTLDNEAFVNVAAGGGGSIAINAQNLNMAGGSTLRAGIDSRLASVGSVAGDIEINATGTINLTNESLIGNRVAPGAVGKGGSINITTGSLFATNGAYLNATTYGQGDGGSVNINARDTVSFNGVGSNGLRSGAFSNVAPGAVGKGGGINITTGLLFVTNGAVMSTSTYGQGDGGSVNINARDTASFDGESGALSRVEFEGVGKGGNINVTAGSLSLTNGAELAASTRGYGNAGSVIIQVSGPISLDGVSSNGVISGAFSNVAPRAVGKGGDIYVTAESLSASNGAQLSTAILGQGDGGSVNINARDTISFDGLGSNGLSSGAFSTVDFEGMGKGGNINITTGSLFATNGAGLAASTFGKGDAGSVTIIARDMVSFDGINGNVRETIDGLSINGRRSGVGTSVFFGAVGNGGDISITTGTLSVTNGAGLAANSSGQGNSGSININARDTISVDGVNANYSTVGISGESLDIGRSGLSTQVAPGAVGNGGNINLSTKALSVTNGALLTASSRGSGAAGNIEVSASSIRLYNQAFLISDTIAGQGNIILRSEDLVLRYGSNITTNATGTATGGNVTIDTGVIAALEDSDISANAQDAFGGRVTINAQGIFGTAFRNQLTPLSDITASSNLGSKFSGTVEINTPGIDPSRGLIDLPAELVNVTGLIAQGCPGGGNVGRGESKFIITGRGGLPPNPREPLRSDAVRVSLDTPTLGKENRATAETATNPTSAAPATLVEAQGWMINNLGEVVLTAHAPNVTPNVPWMTPATCHSSTSGTEQLPLISDYGKVQSASLSTLIRRII